MSTSARVSATMSVASAVIVTAVPAFVPSRLRGAFRMPGRLPNPRFKFGPRVCAGVAVLDDDRRREREPPLDTLAVRHGARTGNDDRASRHDQRSIGGGLDDLAAYEI